ncbi:MAG: hypothetical protein QM820_04350 [Minicystis sp.]
MLLDRGAEFNAFYDRRALSFFHGAAAGRTVFSGESPDIVFHEFGHAVLDAIRPQLWDVMAFETAAFHESFGDMSAILAALQLRETRLAVLAETGGDLARSSRLSRLAEQLGWAIRQRTPDAVDADCLRNAVHSLSYVPPRRLPMIAPASVLSREPHSLSRVFTGAFFEALAGMFASRATHTEADLQDVAVDMGRYLVQAVIVAPVVSSYFARVGALLARAAAADSPAYAAAIRAAMVRRGIVSVRHAVAMTRGPVDRSALSTSALPSTHAMPMMDLDVSDYGLSVPTIRAFGVEAADPSGAHGTAPSQDPQEEASAFFDDLMAQGRIDMGTYAEPAGTAIAQPATMKTHALERDGDHAMLRRMLIDCASC